jgi:hypothetical protein
MPGYSHQSPKFLAAATNWIQAVERDYKSLETLVTGRSPAQPRDPFPPLDLSEAGISLQESCQSLYQTLDTASRWFRVCSAGNFDGRVLEMEFVQDLQQIPCISARILVSTT